MVHGRQAQQLVLLLQQMPQISAHLQTGIADVPPAQHMRMLCTVLACLACLSRLPMQLRL